ncbi:MAG: PilZ domain-containing protein [Candidatus Gorgyraea atricola]|nr:PilZ domain-containing protein [Candidatus Gorgyraea atricola]
MAQERRSFNRTVLSAALRYQQKGSQRFGNSVCRDISKSGIGFASDEFFPVATNLVFEFQHPQTNQFIKAAGEIAWISSQPHSERYSVGARFFGPPVAI